MGMFNLELKDYSDADFQNLKAMIESDPFLFRREKVHERIIDRLLLTCERLMKERDDCKELYEANHG